MSGLNALNPGNTPIESPLDAELSQPPYEYTNSELAVHTIQPTHLPLSTPSPCVSHNSVHILSLPFVEDCSPPAADNTSDIAIPSNIVTDVYLLDATGKPAFACTSNPFLTVPNLHGPQGEHVRFLTVIDNGTMINAINMAAYQRIAQWLAPLGPSTHTLRMANSSLVASSGIWNGTLEWGLLCIHTTFEVFPSSSSWQMLMGKPLLEQIKVVQDYRSDSIMVHMGDQLHQFHNFSSFHPLPLPSLPSAISFPDVAQFAPPHTGPDPLDNTSKLATTLDASGSTTTTEELELCTGDAFALHSVTDKQDIFTRLTEKGLFYPPHVQKIIESVKVGTLKPHEIQEVHSLLTEFADVFTLSVKEVKPVSHIKYRLDILQDTALSVRVNQCSLTLAQKEFYFP